MTFPKFKFSRKAPMRHAAMRQSGKSGRNPPEPVPHAVQQETICCIDQASTLSSLCSTSHSAARENGPKTAETWGKSASAALLHAARLDSEKNDAVDWYDMFEERAAIAEVLCDGDGFVLEFGGFLAVA